MNHAKKLLGEDQPASRRDTFVEVDEMDAWMGERGWENIGTGGGCTAYSRAVSDITFLIANNAEAPTSLRETVTLSLVHGQGATLGWFDPLTVQEAMDLVEKFST